MSTFATLGFDVDTQINDILTQFIRKDPNSPLAEAVNKEFSRILDNNANAACTFQSCNKRLKNNVVFTYHIWAHVSHQKPTVRRMAEHNGDEDEAKSDDQRTDVSRLHTCPECLLEQPTPYRARLHYHRPFFQRTKSVPGVHKRGKRPLLDSNPELHVCNICEQVIDTKNMQHHIVAHALSNKRMLALPYGCHFVGGKCQFSSYWA
ncbi:hypothetical protein GPALN_010370 [Globodera pallida]|nr:hypothetical protein GPALN_010370 [Globodera pallida]